MELLFLAILIVIMASALGAGYPVAFALPGAAIISISLAAICGYVFAGNMDAYFHSGGPGQWLSAGVTNLRGVYWEVERDTLIAIPLFIFMGIMLQRSKIAEDLLVTMAQMFGPIPGGLGISVVFVGALLAATTGIVGATVVAMGLISLPAMLRNNYSKSLATGTIAASGTLGQIIPPSIVLIILADQLASATDQASTARKALHKASTGELSMPSVFDLSSTSAGEMFLGAFIPGLVLVGLYMIYILVIAVVRPGTAPAVHYDGAYDRKFWGKVLLTLVPPLTLIFLVLGSIVAGIATVNQAGAIGAAGALIMAGYRLKEGHRTTYYPALLAILALALAGFAIANYPMNIKAATTPSDWTGITIGIVATILLLASLIWSGWRAFKVDDTLQGVMVETAKTTSLVFIILLGAAMLTAAFRAFGGEELVKNFLEGLPGGFWSKFIMVMAVIFVLGFFLDFIEIAVVVVPIVAPILLADPSANVTAVWLGVMIGLNIQTSFLTPPFGFALFYLRGVAPAIVKTLDMYKGVIAFIALQIGALFIVANYPQLVNYLPNRVSLLSDTAPPPRNPRLQYCVEEYVYENLVLNGSTVTSLVSNARSYDTSLLPKKLASDFAKGLDEVGNASALLKSAKDAEAVVAKAAESFRPIHTLVRSLERDARGFAAEVKELKTSISRLRGDDNAPRRERAEARVQELESERDALLAQIPAEWKERQETFSKLNKEEVKLRGQYRRASDGAYESVSQLAATLASSADYVALKTTFDGLRSDIENKPLKEMEGVVNALSKQFDAIEGASQVKSGLSKVRRELKRKTPRVARALTEFDKTLERYNEQVDWRSKVPDDLIKKVSDLEEGLKDTIGIRLQPKMSRVQALDVAACQSGHRDISLNF